ncbi:MAG: 4Fe-4S binding protein [Eubacterium sp.]|jgi:dissimilatory sulfite reductase (desulfoviridin) alpha/beta subunit|nr:4Fe-4S binding protein [Eubacterium sp.]MCH4047239.1 4Fe-4S binding protein [Eubacterium sp.]MCH4080334.1 4Fe-4S binding protein [Eubacterium sp.]MCI1307308.1 4Fe-4S binding protein [Eubacterium sp.]MCI1405826.1 4Fe-4S binding protein [Eubacterium sp.]
MATDYAALKKGGWMRQKQKNRFALRVHVIGGKMTEEQLIGVSKVAEKYGQGYVHLTARQSLEIPYMKLEDIEEIKKELAKYNVEPSVCGPRVRTTTACQGADTCPSACIYTYELAEEIDQRYFAKELPGKFKFGITGCQNNCLKTEENDIGIKGAERVEWIPDKCIQCGVCVKACREGAVSLEDGKISIDQDKCTYCGRCAKSCPMDAYEEHPGYIMSFGGMYGNHFHKGRQLTPFVESHDKLIQMCDATIQFFHDHAQPGDRLQFAIAREGEDKFDEMIRKVYATSEEEAHAQASKPLELTDWKLRADLQK